MKPPHKMFNQLCCRRSRSFKNLAIKIETIEQKDKEGQDIALENFLVTFKIMGELGSVINDMLFFAYWFLLYYVKKSLLKLKTT